MVEKQSAEVCCQEGAARDYAVIAAIVALPRGDDMCVMPSSAALLRGHGAAVALFRVLCVPRSSLVYSASVVVVSARQFGVLVSHANVYAC